VRYTRLTSTLALTIALAACASHPRAAETSEPGTVATTPCQAVVQDLRVAAWRQYTTPDFTVCLPNDWQVDRNGAHSGASTISWGRGEPRARIVKMTQRVTVEAGDPPPTGQPVVDSDVNRVTEYIAGKAAELWRNRLERHFYTGVKWDSPQVWLRGEAETERAADLEVAIYHTVRFSAVSTSASRPPDAQEYPLARYGIADEIVLADSGDVRFVATPPPLEFGPRDPQVSAAFVVMFIVDTLGRVEMPSVSFGNDVLPSFVKAVCRGLGDAEYHPMRRDGSLRRALVVEALMIQRSNSPSVDSVSAEPLRKAIKEYGVVEILPIFARQPHCE
jgi:hypothetical protein